MQIFANHSSKMGVKTSNIYGNIIITDEAIAQIVGITALECYGIVDVVSKKFSDSLMDIFKNHRKSRGVRITTFENKIYIDLFVFVKFGVSIDAVSHNLKRTTRHAVEKFTNMIVETVNINVVGVKL